MAVKLPAKVSSEPNDESMFIIEVQPQLFFAGFAPGGQVRLILTEYPSQATHLYYVQADKLCGFFRTRKFDCVVCDIYGRPMDAVRLQACVAS